MKCVYCFNFPVHSHRFTSSRKHPLSLIILIQSDIHMNRPPQEIMDVDGWKPYCCLGWTVLHIPEQWEAPPRVRGQTSEAGGPVPTPKGRGHRMFLRLVKSPKKTGTFPLQPKRPRTIWILSSSYNNPSYPSSSSRVTPTSFIPSSKVDSRRSVALYGDIWVDGSAYTG